MTQTLKMQCVYKHSHEHFEVFTTVLVPHARYLYRTDAEKMVVSHSYKPHWPDEVALSRGDVILVLSKHGEERWFGRLQGGQRGYFPASCVMELGQVAEPDKALRRPVSLGSAWDSVTGLSGRCGGLQALRRGSRGGGGGEGGRAAQERGPTGPPGPQTHSSPGLLNRILSKCRKKSECQGATNRAFEAD